MLELIYNIGIFIHQYKNPLSTLSGLVVFIALFILVKRIRGEVNDQVPFLVVCLLAGSTIPTIIAAALCAFNNDLFGLFDDMGPAMLAAAIIMTWAFWNTIDSLVKNLKSGFVSNKPNEISVSND